MFGEKLYYVAIEIPAMFSDSKLSEWSILKTQLSLNEIYESDIEELLTSYHSNKISTPLQDAEIIKYLAEYLSCKDTDIVIRSLHVIESDKDSKYFHWDFGRIAGETNE